MAFSVLHEVIELRGVSLVQENLACSRYRFALGQCERSLAILNKRRHSQDNQNFVRSSLPAAIRL